MKKTNLIVKFLLYLVLAAVAGITLIPIVYTIFSSFKENMEILNNSAQLLPKSFRFENYQEAWRIADFKTYTINSIMMAGTTAVGTMFFPPFPVMFSQGRVFRERMQFFISLYLLCLCAWAALPCIRSLMWRRHCISTVMYWGFP